MKFKGRSIKAIIEKGNGSTWQSIHETVGRTGTNGNCDVTILPKKHIISGHAYLSQAVETVAVHQSLKTRSSDLTQSCYVVESTWSRL